MKPDFPGTNLDIRELRKDYGANQVLRGVDLECRPGEFTAIVGKSGCGKSTLLRLVAGLERPAGGTILADDEPVRGINARARVMFQDARLLPWKRVVENVGLGLGRDWQVRAMAALEQVGLADRAHDWQGILSGGQKQRVALARALASEPRLLLLDEPLGALDALTRIEMQQLIERLWLRQRFTTLLVTHDVDEAITLADRVIVIDHGAIVLNVAVGLPRPRRSSRPEFAALKEEILDRVMNSRPESRTGVLA